MQSNETGCLSQSIPKINSKCIVNLNIKARFMKLLEKNLRVNLDLELGNSFLDSTQVTSTSHKRKKMNCIKK